MGRAIRPPRPLRVRLNVAGPGLQLLRQVMELAAVLPGWQHGNPAPGAVRSRIQAHNSGSRASVRPGPDNRLGLPGGLHVAQKQRNRLPQDRRLPRAQLAP